VDGTGTGCAGLRRACSITSFFYPPTATKKVRTRKRIDYSSRPPPHPRYLGLHIFCSFGFGLLRLRSTVAGATHFLFLATAAKAAQTKALPKRHSPNACALNTRLSIPKAAKGKKV
jgi:hypothetical protein